MSFIAHTGLLAVMAFFVPPFGLNDAEGATSQLIEVIVGAKLGSTRVHRTSSVGLWSPEAIPAV